MSVARTATGASSRRHRSPSAATGDDNVDPGLHLAEQVWKVRKQNRELQEELEELLDLEQRLEGFADCTATRDALLRRSTELKRELEQLRSRQSGDTSGGALQTDLFQLERYTRDVRQEVALSQRVLADLRAEESALRARVAEREEAVREGEQQREFREQRLRAEAADLGAAVRQLAARLDQLQGEHQSLLPLERLQSLLLGLQQRRSEAVSEVVPLHQYEVLREEAAALRLRANQIHRT
eukprot:TRINITY_DN51309_c0_g1_i1.p1 TRINITY_DN51309_c0_g1~~TRINITY_DN51309_c0_g1_i1.p1  ORF type:complete len:266 (+),score=105.40 TRINITY_DN51309_c0_g1_i1:81-800(+)